MSGSSGTGLSGDVFVGEDGSIDVQALALTVSGGLVTAVGVGVGGVWNAVFQGAISLVGGVTSFGSDVIGSFLRMATDWAALAWSIPTGIVEGMTGLWVPVATFAMALAFLYIVGWADG